MSVRLLPPGKGAGKRRGYKFYYIIGSLDGQNIEESTKTMDYQMARDALESFKESYKKAKKHKYRISFYEVAERFKMSRPHLSKDDIKRIDRLSALIGNEPIGDIVPDHITRIVSVAYPKGAEASTLNRYIITPMSMVLNYASANKWRDPIKTKRFKEKTPPPRFTKEGDEKTLLKFITAKHGNISDEVLIVMWLFRQGDRITDTLNAVYENCDLKKENYMRYISKSDTYDEVPLDPQICSILKRRIKKGATGKIFRWHTRWGVNKWLRGYCKMLGVRITPHMARHTLGKRLNDSGAGLKTIMQVLGQTDPRSAVRYQTTGIEELRKAKDRTIMGKSLGRGKNAK